MEETQTSAQNANRGLTDSAGYSIAAFAKRKKQPYRRIARAVKAKQIKSVNIGGVVRIIPSEDEAYDQMIATGDRQ
jgi:hypothetical protein